MDQDVFNNNKTYEQFQLKLHESLDQEEICVPDMANSILEYLPCGISAVAKDGTFLYVNDLYQKTLGYSFDELVLKKTVMEITTDLPARQVLQNLEAAQTFGRVRKGVGSYNVFRKKWICKNNQIVAGVCKASRFYFKKAGMSVVLSMISFEERPGEYDKVFDFHKDRARPINENWKYHLAAAKTHLTKAFTSWRNS